MKVETPAQGILKVNDWGHSKMYKVECECMGEDCAHIIEVEADDGHVTVTVHASPKTQYWRYNRFQLIWQLLTKGYLKYESTTIMNKQVALNYANVLQSAVKDVETFQKNRSTKEKK